MPLNKETKTYWSITYQLLDNFNEFSKLSLMFTQLFMANKFC